MTGELSGYSTGQPVDPSCATVGSAAVFCAECRKFITWMTNDSEDPLALYEDLCAAVAAHVEDSPDHKAKPPQ